MPEYDAKILTNEKFVSDYFNQCLKLTNKPKQLSNWIMTQILKVLKDKPCEDLNEIITAENLVAIVDMLDKKEITRPNANELFNILCFSDLKAKAVAKEKGMLVTLTDEELEKFVNEVLKNFADALKDYDKTPEKVIMFFTGKVMALSKGQANPLKTQGLLKNKITNIIK